MIDFKRFRLVSSLSFVLVVVSVFPVFAQTKGPERILIRNVILFDPNGVVEDKIVNILIRESKLDLVTEDKVSSEEADLVVNANMGVILGQLEIGRRPSFIVVREDPRENFEVMMDTSTYSRFVVHDGVVVKNWIIGVVADEPEEEPKKSGWLAYTPPPVMVPLSYQSPTKWNRFTTSYVNGTFIAALLLDGRNGCPRMRAVKTRWVTSSLLMAPRSGPSVWVLSVP